MLSKLYKMLFLLLMVTLLLAACGGGDESKEEKPTAPPAKQATKAPATEKAPDPTAEPEAAQAPASTPTKPSEPTPTAETASGEAQRSEAGGYSFQTIPDYTVEEFYGVVTMTGPDADPELGPIVLVIGGKNEGYASSEEILDDFMQDSGDVDVSDRREITVGDVSGIAADISGVDDSGIEMAGRIVGVLVNADQQFIMIGVAPQEQWDALAPQFDTLMASIEFFKPVPVTSLSDEPQEPEAVAPGAVTRQWAISATASSQYGDDDWSASQATGAPDTLGCGDYTSAWASAGSDTVEWIELSYDTPVQPTEINIIQTNSPDQVVKVELIEPGGTYHEVYTNEPASGDCPYMLSIPVEANYQVDGVKITIDQSLASWNEIDAVELVGYADHPGMMEEEPGAALPPKPVSLSPGDLPVIAQPSGWSMYSNANYVLDVALHDGVLWAATRGGLTAWDATSGDFIGKWTSQDGLVHNEASAVTACPLPEPRIVVGTRSGISLYDPATDTWENWTPESGQTQHNYVSGLACDPDSQTLLIGYNGMWVDIYNANTGEWQHYDSYNDGLEGAVASDFAIVGDMQEIWIAGGTAVSVITPDGIIAYEEESSNIPDDSILSVVADDAGNVWMGAADGIIRVDGDDAFTLFDGDNVTDYPIGMSFVEGLGFAPDGTLWASAGFGTVCHLDPATATCIGSYSREPGMAGSFNENLIVDEEGKVYYTSDGEGISFFDGSVWQQLFLEGELIVENDLTALAQGQDGAIWVGTDSNGAQRFYAYDPGGTWESFADEVPNLGIRSFYADDNGGMWVSHGSGGSYYDADGNWTHLGREQGDLGSTQVVAVDALGRVWFGTSFHGLRIWDGKQFTSLSEEEGNLPSDTITDIQPDGEVMWVATSKGLLRFENDEYTLLDKDNSELPDDNIYALALDDDGSLLVAAYRTLMRIDDGGTMTEITKAGDYIRSMTVGPNGEIWLGTFNDGAYYFYGSDWGHFTTADGLAAPAFYNPGQVLVDYMGTIWFANSAGGLSHYVP